MVELAQVLIGNKKCKIACMCSMVKGDHPRKLWCVHVIVSSFFLCSIIAHVYTFSLQLRSLL